MTDEVRDEEATRSGSQDGSDALLARLATAEAAYLEGALDNPAFAATHAVQLLRNPRANDAVLSRLAERSELARDRGVRTGLASHPATPRPLAVDLLSRLGWRDMLTVSLRPATPAPVKRQAERRVESLLESLALGERMHIAAVAPRGLFRALLRERQPQVITALLRNPRLTEADVLGLTREPRLPPAVLEAVAGAGRWSSLPAVRRSVACHPAAPRSTALRCLQGLSRETLRAVARDASCPRLVRTAAERMAHD